jgi:hypothetical protein
VSKPIGGIRVLYLLISVITGLPAIYLATLLAGLLHLPLMIAWHVAAAIALLTTTFLLRITGVPWLRLAAKQAPIGTKAPTASAQCVAAQLERLFGSPAAAVQVSNETGNHMSPPPTPRRSAIRRQKPKAPTKKPQAPVGGQKEQVPTGGRHPQAPIGSANSTASFILAQVRTADGRLSTSERRLAKRVGRHPSGIGPALRCLERQGQLVVERSRGGTILRLPTTVPAGSAQPDARPPLH